MAEDQEPNEKKRTTSPGSRGKHRNDQPRGKLKQTPSLGDSLFVPRTNTTMAAKNSESESKGAEMPIQLADSNAETGMVTFQTRHFNVTDTGCQIGLCIVTFGFSLLAGAEAHGSKNLYLEPEEAVLVKDCMCCHSTTRRPYGELGSVDKLNCGPCVGFKSDIGESCPVSSLPLPNCAG